MGPRTAPGAWTRSGGPPRRSGNSRIRSGIYRIWLWSCRIRSGSTRTGPGNSEAGPGSLRTTRSGREPGPGPEFRVLHLLLWWGVGVCRAMSHHESLTRPCEAAAARGLQQRQPGEPAGGPSGGLARRLLGGCRWLDPAFYLSPPPIYLGFATFLSGCSLYLSRPSVLCFLSVGTSIVFALRIVSNVLFVP